MNKLITVLALTVALCACRKDPASLPHPRLFMDDATFSHMCGMIEDGSNAPLVTLHEACMEYAEGTLDTQPVKYEKDQSGKRILSQSRLALVRIWADAYAYRFSSDRRFLDRAELEMNAVCSFPDWNPSHFLDVAEMTLAVAIGYDWLYDSLKSQTRDLALKALREFAFEESKDYEHAWFYRRYHNWNQVCNAGLVAGALATWEDNPDVSKELVRLAAESNLPCMVESYTPDGNYAEGPGYWESGTMYEAIMLTLMEQCLGTDYGLGEVEGFDKTPLYILYSTGATGKTFNYYDNSEARSLHSAMWYFAARAKDASLLYNELQLMAEGKYNGTRALLFPLLMLYASQLEFPESVPPPSAPVFYGHGQTPVVMVRTGWNFSPEDRYLGVKGGKAISNHGHMDVGSFVYDAYGIRWAKDLGAEPYARIESAFQSMGLDFWDKFQDAGRWMLFRYNNRQHNTLTVNGHDHLIKGFAPLLEVYDSPERMGGRFDLTEAFGGELAKAVRCVSLRDDGEQYLEIVDSLRAPASDAAVCWNMVTEAEPTIIDGGILLSKEGVRLLLSCEGAPVKYFVRSGNPSDYDSPVAHIDSPNPGVSICGFELTLPPETSATLTTTLRKTD